MSGYPQGKFTFSRASRPTSTEAAGGWTARALFLVISYNKCWQMQRNETICNGTFQNIMKKSGVAKIFTWTPRWQ